MENLSVDEQQRLRDELGSGESVVWTGKPNLRVIFHRSDWFLIPFSLLWGGFAIFWEGGVTGLSGFGGGKPAPSFFMLWGIPFVLIGQYFIWGRFLYAAWRKKRIVYAVTNLRVLVLVSSPGAKVISAFLESIPTVNKEVRANGTGTLKFGYVNPIWASGRRTKTSSADGLYLDEGVPVFVDIAEPSRVASLVADLRTKLKSTI